MFLLHGFLFGPFRLCPAFLRNWKRGRRSGEIGRPGGSLVTLWDLLDLIERQRWPSVGTSGATGHHHNILENNETLYLLDTPL